MSAHEIIATKIAAQRRAPGPHASPGLLFCLLAYRRRAPSAFLTPPAPAPPAIRRILLRALLGLTPTSLRATLGAYSFDDLRATRSPSRRAYDVLLQRSIAQFRRTRWSWSRTSTARSCRARAKRSAPGRSTRAEGASQRCAEDGKLFFATVRCPPFPFAISHRDDLRCGQTTLSATTPRTCARGASTAVRALHGWPGARALLLRFFPALAPVAVNTSEALVDSTKPNLSVPTDAESEAQGPPSRS
ncbi:hypothetical protein FB451DRAFT_1454070 [Mycena latifolia]|nr:hypothetical protein FB451DRAFT_1454070 [Mycena latifolia]